MSGIFIATLAGGGPVISLDTPVTVTYSSGGIFSAFAGYQVRADGFIYTAANFNGVYSQQEQWCAPVSAAGDYEVRATLTLGDTPNGAFPNNSALATWLPLTTDRGWELNASPGNVFSCSLTIEIRDAATSTVRATALIDLFANAV